MPLSAGAALALDALGLAPSPPEPRFLEELFLRFQRRVACESLTRGLWPAGDIEPDRALAGWAEEDWGLAGTERLRAFAALAAGLGFNVSVTEGTCVRMWSGRASRAASHAALLVTTGSDATRRVLADVAYPLPVLVPVEPPAREIPTGFGMLGLRQDGTDGGNVLTVTCDARAEVADIVRLDARSTGASSRGGGLSGDAAEPFALRLHDDRTLYWSGGRMTVLDAWSRLDYPLPSSERAALGSLFGLELEGIDLPETSFPDEAAVLTVYHSSAVLADEARARLSTARVPPSLVARRDVVVEAVPEGSRLIVRATLAKPVPPAGPGEAVRKTLVFHLVSDLLALGRTQPETGPAAE